MASLLILFAGTLNFFCSKSEIILKNTSLFEKIFSFKTILSAQSKPFRQTFHKTSAKKVGNWQNGSSNIRKCDKIWSPGYAIFSLGKAAKSFWATSQRLLLKIWKRQNNFFLNNIVFFKGLIDQNFGNLAGISCQKSRLFFL